MSGASTTETRRKPGPRPTVCAACHVAKIKCDRKRPCNHCARRKLQCVFGDQAGETGDELDGSDKRKKRSRVELKRPTEAHTILHASPSSPTSSSSSSSSSPSSSSSCSSSTSSRRILSPAIYKGPTNDYAQRTWLDHLLSFFGTNPYAARHRVQTLLRRADEYVCEMHRFELTDPYFMRKALKEPQTMSIVDLSTIFALTAVGLRIESQKSAGSSRGWQLLPRDAVGITLESADTSIQLERTAETYLMQALSTTDPRSSSLQTNLRMAQTSAYLMTLQSALSDRYLHFHRFALSVARSPDVRRCMQLDAGERVGSRQSTVQEEAARLSLFPHWTLIQLGATIPNLEFHTLQLSSADLEDAAVCLPWPSRQEWAEKSTAVGDELDEYYQKQGTDIIRKTIRAWQIPFSDDYVYPSAEFDALLSEVEAKEALLGRLRNEPKDDLQAQRYLARCAVAVCHMHGIIIRRTGFFHNRQFRPAIIAALQQERTGAEKRVAGKSDTKPIWKEEIETPAMQIWLDLMTKLSQEVGLKTDNVDAHHLDSLSLYAAATSQYGQGIRNLYSLLGHPIAEQVNIAIRLNAAADLLRNLVDRKRRAATAEIGGT